MAEVYLLMNPNHHEVNDARDLIFAAYSTKEAADRRRQTVIAAQYEFHDWDQRRAEAGREFRRVNNLARPTYRLNIPPLEQQQYARDLDIYESTVAKFDEQYVSDHPEPPNPETWNDLVVVKVEYLD